MTHGPKLIMRVHTPCLCHCQFTTNLKYISDYKMAFLKETFVVFIFFTAIPAILSLKCYMKGKGQDLGLVDCAEVSRETGVNIDGSCTKATGKR